MFKKCLEEQVNFVTRRIPRDIDKIYFFEAMQRVRKIVVEEENYMWAFEFHDALLEAERMENTYWSFGNKKKYSTMRGQKSEPNS